jgi:NAD-dependent deacetylase
MLPREAVDRLEAELRRGFDAVVSIGTTSVFPYVAAPVHLARSWGAGTVEVNPGETEVSAAVDVRLRCGAADAMESLVAALRHPDLR